tara:strand:- start:490 stop:768 length:279 start_codon:yes stop_codon:yes gene_type:complete
MKKFVENVGYEVHVKSIFGSTTEQSDYLDVIAGQLNGCWVDDANDCQSYDFKNVMDAFDFQYSVLINTNGYSAVVEMLKLNNDGSEKRIKVG